MPALRYVGNVGTGFTELVAEVEFATWTGDGMLRQPRWRGLKDG